MMNSRQTLSALAQLLMITKTMQQKAQQQLWDEITTLEQQRQTMINTIFPINENDMSTQITEKIQKIIDLNQELETQCRQAKQEVQVQMKGLNRNKNAAAAYGSV